MTSVNEQYFRHKKNAGTVCKVGKYLMENNITDEDLENEVVVAKIKELIPTNVKLNQLRTTIRIIDIDVLKTKPWHINSGVLFIAGVEYVLYPQCCNETEEDIMNRTETLNRIYSGEGKAVTDAFNTLFYTYGRYSEDKTKSLKSFFKIENRIGRNIQHLESIREYLNTIEFSNEELEFIRQEMQDAYHAHART